MNRILIKDACIITGNSPKLIITQGYISIRDGKVTRVEKGSCANPENYDQIIDATDKIVIPGLLNAHYHSYANYVKGLAPTVPLEQWMLYIMAQGSVLTAEDVYWNTLLGALEMIKTGTTACIDHLAQGSEALDAAMQAYSDIGMRATLAPMISDKPYAATLPISWDQVPDELKQDKVPDADELVNMTIELLKKWHQEEGRLQVGFGPSGPQRCSDRLISLCVHNADKYNTILHSHVLETKAQADTSKFLYGENMLFHLDKLGFLTPKTTLVHAVWLTDDEIKLAAVRGVTVVHNPASNFLLGSGIAPINKYRANGVRVALGTDGANVSGNLSMFDAIRLTSMIHNFSEVNSENWVKPQEALNMATIDGAKAFSQKELGTIEPGKTADLVILDPQGNLVTFL
jgi:5-methylthioadenosine/S-adenosylhomocysteine deaminase